MMRIITASMAVLATPQHWYLPLYNAVMLSMLWQE